MIIEQIQTTKLIPYARNSRTHDDAQVAQIAASIKEFGFNNPVLIGPDNDIIAGHGRLLAARKLELKSIPCIRLGHLTQKEKQAYVIVDNRIALNAGWDDEMLKLELADLKETDIDLEMLGFSLADLEDAMVADDKVADGEPEDLAGTKQLVLVFQVEEYKNLIKDLNKYCEKYDLPDHAEAVKRLIKDAK
jgi:ParB-like chromosome segregation protein Spo0J